MVEIRCDCGKLIAVPPAHYGKRAACPTCKQPLRVVCSGGGEESPDSVLVIVAGPRDAGERIYIGGRGPVSVGKLPESDIRLRGEKVSRKHCRLVRTESGWCVEDERSTNGLAVNGTRAYVHDLRQGDKLRIGEYEFEFVVVDAPPQRNDTPAPETTTADAPALATSADEATDEGPLPLADEE